MQPPRYRLIGLAARAGALLAFLTGICPASAAHAAVEVTRASGVPVRVTTHADFFPPPTARAGQLELIRAGSRFEADLSPLARGSRWTALPSSWCGTERRTDDTRHALTDAPRVKVVYAYPRGIPNRFSLLADIIQQDVAVARAAVAAASRGRKTIRFDMGTDCPGKGARYVDIQSVALPHDAAHYGFDAELAAARLRSDLRRSLRLRGRWNVTTYVDGVTPGEAGGIATSPVDETRGAANDANLGGQYAFVFGDGSPQFNRRHSHAFIHETLHTLGAVQDGAPHATNLGHCFDGEDVMCYDDGGPAAPRPWPAPSCAGASRIDCGANDYFAARPPRGSYLATHWNLFNSAFMCALARCDTPDIGQASLSAALGQLTRRLRRAGLPGPLRHGPVKARFRARHGGRLSLTVAAGRRTLFAGRRAVGSAGPVTVIARPLAPARRLARAASLRITVRLSFMAGGRSHAARASTLLVRRP